jgi:hypothetical protein
VTVLILSAPDPRSILVGADRAAPASNGRRLHRDKVFKSPHGPLLVGCIGDVNLPSPIVSPDTISAEPGLWIAHAIAGEFGVKAAGNPCTLAKSLALEIQCALKRLPESEARASQGGIFVVAGFFHDMAASVEIYVNWTLAPDSPLTVDVGKIERHYKPRAKGWSPQVAGAAITPVPGSRVDVQHRLLDLARQSDWRSESGGVLTVSDLLVHELHC